MKKQLDARIISGGVDSMPKEQKERALEVFRKMYENYPDLFDNPDEDENGTENE